jgi:hypothetical protein
VQGLRCHHVTDMSETSTSNIAILVTDTCTYDTQRFLLCPHQVPDSPSCTHQNHEPGERRNAGCLTYAWNFAFVKSSRSGSLPPSSLPLPPPPHAPLPQNIHTRTRHVHAHQTTACPLAAPAPSFHYRNEHVHMEAHSPAPEGMQARKVRHPALDHPSIPRAHSCACTLIRRGKRGGWNSGKRRGAGARGRRD